jgi:hypothetical protein
MKIHFVTCFCCCFYILYGLQLPNSIHCIAGQPRCSAHPSLEVEKEYRIIVSKFFCMIRFVTKEVESVDLLSTQVWRQKMSPPHGTKIICVLRSTILITKE